MDGYFKWFQVAKKYKLSWLIFCWLIASGPCLALALFVHWLDTDGSLAPKPVFENNSLLFNIFFGGFISPFIETFFLITPILYVFNLSKKKVFSVLLGSLPIILIHNMLGWSKVLIVFWLFLWSGLCSMEIYSADRRFWEAFYFAFLIHALNNIFFAMLDHFF